MDQESRGCPPHLSLGIAPRCLRGPELAAEVLHLGLEPLCLCPAPLLTLPLLLPHLIDQGSQGPQLLLRLVQRRSVCQVPRVQGLQLRACSRVPPLHVSLLPVTTQNSIIVTR